VSQKSLNDEDYEEATASSCLNVATGLIKIPLKYCATRRDPDHDQNLLVTCRISTKNVIKTSPTFWAIMLTDIQTKGETNSLADVIGPLHFRKYTFHSW